MKLQSIQVLRGLAALLVVFYHMRALEVRAILEHGGDETAMLGGLITNGYAGVDLFFVISGFIMVYVTWQIPRGNRSSPAFLFSRLTRIYPVWWVFASLAAIYTLAVYGNNALNADNLHPIWGSEPLISYLFRSFALWPQSEYPILNVGWTLIHEVYFYIIFALIMLLPRQIWLAMFTLWSILIVTASIAGINVPIATTISGIITHPMTMEFIIGGGVGIAVMSGVYWRPGMVTLFATITFCIALCMQGAESEFLLGWGRVFWFGLPSALLIYGLANIEIEQRLSWAVPALLGGTVIIAIFQLYGLTDESARSLRITATIVAVITGVIIMSATLWMGWVIGISKPDILLKLQPYLSAIWRALARIGDWSYSLYLCHLIVLFGLKIGFDFLVQLLGDSPASALFNIAGEGILANIAFATLGLILAVTASHLSYEHIEKRFMRIFGTARRKYFRSQTAARTST